MTNSVIQTSFHAGEWAPALNARVDMAKYKAGAALLRNFFVDYRGGASSRSGMQYILQCFNPDNPVRLIPFQASFDLGFVLEFGEGYIRPYLNRAPVLEDGASITNINKDPNMVITVANTYNVGDVVFVRGVNGMTQVNNRFFEILSQSSGDIEAGNLRGDPTDSTGFGTYTGSGSVRRVHSFSSPYHWPDLPLLKFVQNVADMIIVHPAFPVMLLHYNSPTDWTIEEVVFGAGIEAPDGVAVNTTLGAGSVHYAYCITAISVVGEESSPSEFAILSSRLDLRTTPGTNTITWDPVDGAESYNVYKAELSYAGAIPNGSQMGFIGNVTGEELIDSNIPPDFSVTPPIPFNPFSGSGVSGVNVGSPGSYDEVPSVSFSAGAPTAVGNAIMRALSMDISSGGDGYAVSDTVSIIGGAVIRVDSITFVGGKQGVIATATLLSGGSTASIPSNPVPQVATSGSGVGATFDIVWGVASVSISSPGAGYGLAPSVSFNPSGATATATIGAPSAGNPTAVAIHQQRLVLAGQTGDPQAFYMSQPGALFNFDRRNPVQADDSIAAALTSGKLNEIKSMISMPAGLIIFTNMTSWLVNGGSAGAPVTPIDTAANAQSYNGASDMPPIVANFEILYGQAKGSVIRDLTYNFYANVYMGTDISVLSSHLFYGYTLLEWAWAEEPFKTAWVVRNDGQLLSLTFQKEQELIGWAHSDTDGLFESVCTVTEQTEFGAVDAVYVVVSRTIDGDLVKYVERMVERQFTNGAASAWCVDCGLQYQGSPEDSFQGGEFLAGKTVVGLADGVEIEPFVMPTSGLFTLPVECSVLTIGLPFTAQLQTLELDVGEPTIQGKRKKITAVTLKVQETLGIKIGGTFDTLVDMKDTIVGNVGSCTNEVVTDLVTGDVRTVIDPAWTVPGQYCIEQRRPFPVSVLGVIPEIVVGDK